MPYTTGPPSLVFTILHYYISTSLNTHNLLNFPNLFLPAFQFLFFLGPQLTVFLVGNSQIFICHPTTLSFAHIPFSCAILLCINGIPSLFWLYFLTGHESMLYWGPSPWPFKLWDQVLLIWKHIVVAISCAISCAYQRFANSLHLFLLQNQ